MPTKIYESVCIPSFNSRTVCLVFKILALSSHSLKYSLSARFHLEMCHLTSSNVVLMRPLPCYQVEMTVRVSADLTSACPRGCSGHGQCLQGQCQCSPGYVGQDCALSKYSVLFCLTVHLASVAPGTASASRASASAAQDTSDRTVRSVSIQCFFALVLLRARPVPAGPVPVQPRIHRTGLRSQ